MSNEPSNVLPLAQPGPDSKLGADVGRVPTTPISSPSAGAVPGDAHVGSSATDDALLSEVLAEADAGEDVQLVVAARQANARAAAAMIAVLVGEHDPRVAVCRATATRAQLANRAAHPYLAALASVPIVGQLAERRVAAGDHIGLAQRRALRALAASAEQLAQAMVRRR